MSRSLQSTIKREINERERIKRKEQAEKERAERKKTEDAMWATLDKEFEECLASFRNYKGHTVKNYDINHLYYFREVARDLGFTLNNISESGYNGYLMCIPPFEKGGKRTPAQKKLLEFERRLRKAQQDRKSELLAECKRVKGCMEEGNYEHQILHRYGIALDPEDDATFVRVIIIKSQETAETDFERKVIYNFFYGLKLYLKNAETGKWSFTL